MTGTKSLFQELDEKQKNKVYLGNAKEMEVEGKGTLVLSLATTKLKYWTTFNLYLT